MSRYDKAAGSASDKATDSRKLPTISAYLRFFGTSATRFEIAEAYLGIASASVIRATRNGGRIPAITNNAGKLASEAREIADALASGSSARTFAGIDSDIANAIERLTAVRRAFAEAGKGATVKPLASGTTSAPKA